MSVNLAQEELYSATCTAIYQQKLQNDDNKPGERAYVFSVDKTHVCNAHVFLLVIDHVNQRCFAVALSVQSYQIPQTK